MTEFARRTGESELRRYALHFSGVLDRLNVAGGGLVAITGGIAIFVFGYSPLTPWVLAAIVLYVMIVGTGIFFWGRIGRELEGALKAGDDARVNGLLLSPRNIAVSRVENVLFVTLIALMVLRPGI